MSTFLTFSTSKFMGIAWFTIFGGTFCAAHLLTDGARFGLLLVSYLCWMIPITAICIFAAMDGHRDLIFNDLPATEDDLNKED